MRATLPLGPILALFALCSAAAPAAAEGLGEVTEEAARQQCPQPADAVSGGGPCSAAEFGTIGTVDGRVYLYGLYSRQNTEGGSLATDAVVYERVVSGGLHVVFAPGEPGVFLGKPRLLHAGGRILLHLPAYESGTGNFNRERLYVRRDGARTPVDTTGWLKTLAAELPAGYEVWKGVYPDYARMIAATPLWRKKTDGNCCPTGGRADIVLGWRGDRVVLQTVKVRLGAKYVRQL